ncbi:hypothetical protein CG50_14845 [Paenirhodobacter enshiensis]|uniref:Uncharacterized protein n=2 Tax=Paenirhodobacter enshiensis TaxID=1105367 RepID=A0A086Y1L5_9RHOB|nr:hypothetical protein CG50_14845 [Paenirhodobacter enshiensis]
MATLKDLRHRSILELATGGLADDPEEIRRWGSFSAPAVIYIMGGNEVRERYGLSWQDAMDFSTTALSNIRVPFSGYPQAKVFDLGAVTSEIWAGRFDFQNDEPDLRKGWNYFFGTIDSVPDNLRSIKEARKLTHERVARRNLSQDPIEENEVAGCLMINASRLCRDFWQRAKAHDLPRNWENR